jgi:hypothetical protein
MSWPSALQRSARQTCGIVLLSDGHRSLDACIELVLGDGRWLPISKAVDEVIDFNYISRSSSM